MQVMDAALAEVPKRRGRPPIGPEPKTREEHLERMRNYADKRKDDAQEYRRLMQGLPRPMSVDEILRLMQRMNINDHMGALEVAN